jgi:SAM-dependent methyltransferase
MSELTEQEKIIYNNGERLIPHVTHDYSELRRHRSSYLFFRLLIDMDINMGLPADPVRIVDLVCGVGHGCLILSALRNSEILGIDNSKESLEYAEQHYRGPNISYQMHDLDNFISAMPEFDYAVSRGVFEHIRDGLQLAFSTKWRYRLLFDVPYDEIPGLNPHHVLSRIKEEAFDGVPGLELFFQDLQGTIYDVRHKPPRPNMIICVRSCPGALPVGNMPLEFPLELWRE